MAKVYLEFSPQAQGVHPVQKTPTFASDEDASAAIDKIEQHISQYTRRANGVLTPFLVLDTAEGKAVLNTDILLFAQTSKSKS